MQHVVCVKVMDMCLDQNRNSVSRTIALSIYGRVGGVGVDVGVGVVDGIDGCLGVVLRVVLAWVLMLVRMRGSSWKHHRKLKDARISDIGHLNATKLTEPALVPAWCCQNSLSTRQLSCQSPGGRFLNKLRYTVSVITPALVTRFYLHCRCCPK